ncbi:Pls/PosA family non-ribosomal peptide synthetase [Streptoalloteichus hindustanus]|uniref:Pls/PosA family non-ribosomal peptide synthetase n=1 Tax=Streptoalloteichus hindustanus TaxID=2017 RepID=UPI001F1D4D78|nr:Pls/PosA family non-ribosomal peptide synthetase [Streptoalloteichus hindustanus]
MTTTTHELCLHELFGAQVAENPDTLALVCEDRGMTYRELDEATNRLARRLRQLGAGPGTFVAVYCQRSELPILAVLACHKSGAAYVPVDPGLPVERVRHMAGEVGLTLCLTESELADRAGEFFAGTPTLVLDVERPEIDRLSGAPLDEAFPPDELAYVIYTSGTTGRPKGLMTEHRHVTRFVQAFNEVCGTGQGDRVYQGFALSFDGSVEEIWMAFSNGSTLVVPGRDAPRFGEELGRYLTELGITYFSTVPTLLATLPQDVPSIHTLVLSGEACPPELVNRWARPGRRLLNVYGPTEATVNTTAAECLPGEPVTIGRPLPGYHVTIVDEDLRPVPTGTSGELLISGETLARGYLNQPELTESRFLVLDHDGDGTLTRFYRTGDLGRWNDDGELEFLGRADDQVKIRGYRVELAEIESVLLEHPLVSAACVRLVEREGLHELAAAVVCTAEGVEPDRDEVLDLLTSRMPAYMVPGYLDVLPEFPRTTSGKIDRKRMPEPKTPLVRAGRQVVAPDSDLERGLARVWGEVLGVPEISVEDDFFTDLGGHSLVAARIVTQVRQETSRPITVRDVYQFPTIRQLAARLETVAATEDRPASAAKEADGEDAATQAPYIASGWRRLVAGTAQALSLYVVSGAITIPATLLFLVGVQWVRGSVPTSQFLGLALGITVLTWPVLMVLSIAAKWLLIGRYKPGEHRLWGWFYLRWWLVNKLSAAAGVGSLSGTPLLPVYFRLMGAKVGRGCTIDTTQVSAWDLVSIGSDTSIGASTHLLGYRVEGGMLRLGRVDIGSRCFVGIHSALGLNVRMGDDSHLDDQSLLPDGTVVAPGTGLRGSPAAPAQVELPEGPAPASTWRRALLGSAQLGSALALLALMTAVPLVGFVVMARQFLVWDVWLGVAATLALVPVWFTGYCVYIALLKRLVSLGIRPGTYSVLGVTYFRKWLSDQLMGIGRPLLLPVYTTLYFPPLLRLMGAKIGPRAEISAVWSMDPELVDVSGESFFADGSIIGGRRCHRGRFTIAVNRIGHRSFVGNNAVLPVGQSLGDGCLLGVQSVPPAGTAQVADGTEWLGSPSFVLPHRVKVGGFDSAVTFQPTRKLYLQRAFIDGLRALIPSYLVLGAAALAIAALVWAWDTWGLAGVLLTAPAVGFASQLCTVLAVAAIKKITMGTFQPVIRPLWSVYVWVNEMVNGAYESVSAPVLSQLLGTPMINPFLRLMGCRIGKGVYMGTTLFSEFDLVHIGDHAVLNHGVVVQNHLFEDRVFKSSSLHIGEEASIGNLSVVLYDSVVERAAVVGPLSLVMKGETLPGRTRWHGIPTEKPE